MPTVITLSLTLARSSSTYSGRLYETFHCVFYEFLNIVYPKISTNTTHVQKSLLKFCKRQLVSQTQRQSSMLQHVIKAQVFNLILRRVDLAV